MKEVGLLLKQTRQEQGILIDEVAKELKIKPHFIEEIENGNAASISGDIYVNGCIKGYANWLGLDGKSLISTLKNQKKGLAVGKNPVSEKSSYVSTESTLQIPDLKYIVIAIIIAVAVYFIYSQKTISTNNIDQYLQNNIESPTGIAVIKNDTRQIILMANADLDVYIAKADGTKSTKEMKSGEIFFVTTEQDSFITSNKPEALDVFNDEEQSQFLGTLSDIKQQ